MLIASIFDLPSNKKKQHPHFSHSPRKGTLEDRRSARARRQISSEVAADREKKKGGIIIKNRVKVKRATEKGRELPR